VLAVDAYEFSALRKDVLSRSEMSGVTTTNAADDAVNVEYKPHFHEVRK
tara:strand:- start:2891 stop:3037 length:147 start_codon:yes stop_codon:yes gene_type:complete